MKRMFLTVTVLFFALAASAQGPQPGDPQPQPEAQQSDAPIVSPDVASDGRVTFRLHAPNVQKISVSLEGKSLPMQKDEQGVWTVTSEPLSPDYYGYEFVLDEVGMLDPSNYRVIPNVLYRSSEVHVPGPSLSWEVSDIPHGEIHHHFYKSKIVGDDRGFYVYTPPNYDPRGKQTYPVLYLLHGYSDDATAWTAVGRANVILDNLIAQGKAQPMLVVMPLGYGEPKVLLPHSGIFEDPNITQRNFDRFSDALLTEVIPQVESAYLAKKDRNSRGITGLSMGGSESLLTGLNHLDKFAWIGAFSSGGINGEFAKEFPALNEKSNQQIRLLWIACGTDDHLIDINRDFRKWLASKSIAHADIETPGAHQWQVWRRNLTAFAPLLFR